MIRLRNLFLALLTIALLPWGAYAPKAGVEVPRGAPSVVVAQASASQVLAGQRCRGAALPGQSCFHAMVAVASDAAERPRAAEVFARPSADWPPLRMCGHQGALCCVVMTCRT